MELFRRKVVLTAENLDRNETTTIEDLQVEFEIVRTLEKEPSTLRATVYNLSEETRSKLEAPDRIVLTLAAGYGDTAHNLFKGDLRRTYHQRDGGDIATTLEAGDGYRGSKEWARKWFPKNTSIRTILEYLIDKARIGEGNLSEAMGIEEANGLPDEIRAGRHVRGYALDELNELCNSRGIEFSVQDGEAQFLPIDDFKNGVPISQVRPASGLIGSPTIDNEGVMNCTTLLLPNIFPGSRIDIESEFVSGRFVVKRATYSGSVFGDDFSIQIEGKELK